MAPAHRTGLSCLVLITLCQLPLAARVQGMPGGTGNGLRVTPQGNVTELLVDPHDGQIVYAATASNGVYRSGNGGATWQQVARGLPAGVAVTGMVAGDSPRGVVYVSTPSGVYRTTNAGATWASQGPPTSSGSTSIAVIPGSSGSILAGTAGDGIYRSDNGGSTWAAIGPRLATVQVVATDPITGTTIYAGTDDGLLINDPGHGWRRAGLGHVGVQALAISASDPLTLYAGTDSGVLLSRDGGDTWTRDGLKAASVTTLYASPADAKFVYAGSSHGDGLYRSTNGGRSWHHLTAGLSSGNLYSLGINPHDPSIAYAGLDHGVFKSLQAGSSWASSTIYDRSVLAVVQPGGSGGLYYAATNGGVYSSAGGAIWTSAGLGNHSVQDVLTLAPTAPLTGTTLLAATDAGIYVSDDQGHSWAYTLRIRAHAMALDPATSTVYAGTDLGLFASKSRGRHWSQLASGAQAFDALLVRPGSTLYAAGSAGLVWSTDGGVSFQRSGVGGETVLQLLGLVGRGGGALILARTSGGQLYRTADRKQWTDVSVGGEQTAALTLGADGNLYAATGRGIYRSSNAGTSWILTDQQDPSIRPLVLQPSLGAGQASLLEGLSDQGVIVRTLTVTPTSPFAPIANASIGQFFPQTGHFVRAPFLDWYTSHGGAAIFGLPRTEARKEQGLLVQYFQDAILVYHPDLADTPRVIGLQPLGQQLLGTPMSRIAAFENTTTRRYFPQTGHSLAGEFLSFWRRYGGVDVFGLPIGEPLIGNGVTVQYFQNVRLEADQSTGDTYFHTRLSALGDRVLKDKGWLQ